MVSITPYLTDGSKFTYSPGQGGGFKQLFLVTGLDPTNGATPALAAFATDAGTGFYIPLYAQVHPNVPNFFVACVESEPFPKGSRTSCLVTVTYRPPEYIPGATRIEIISANGNKLISRWLWGGQKGNPIIIGYDPQNSTSFPNQISPANVAAAAAGVQFDFHSINVLSPNTILRFTRRESTSPLLKSQQYRRTVNNSTWQGGAAGTWLCTAIDGRNIVDGGNYVAPGFYEVTYSFSHDEDSWVQAEVFRDNLTGSVPTDIDFSGGAGTNNGYGLIQPYPQQNFNSLSLPNAT